MKPLRMGAEAEEDLLAIADGLASLSTPAALRFIDELQEALVRTSAFPGSAHRLRDLPQPYRVVTIGEWEVIVREDTDYVAVLRIVHGRRDLRDILR